MNSEKQLKKLYDIYWKDYFGFTSAFLDHSVADWCIEDLEFDSVRN